MALGNSDDDYEDDDFDQPCDQDTPPTEVTKQDHTTTMARQTSPIIGKEVKKGYYENLDESQNLVQKQSENDPLKDFYEMKATKK